MKKLTMEIMVSALPMLGVSAKGIDPTRSLPYLLGSQRNSSSK